jgi:hypothetical protein
MRRHDGFELRATRPGLLPYVGRSRPPNDTLRPHPPARARRACPAQGRDERQETA